MTNDELIALTDHEISTAVGAFDGQLAAQRLKAETYYLGLAKGDLAPPEVEGRSTVVDTFVRNTIEAMLPQLMVKFTGGDSVVEFEPQKPDDEEKAKLCTDYLNYLFWKQNRGHVVAETWMRDALLKKNGIVKVWWDTRTEETKEEYKGLSEVELAQILDDDEVEPTEQKSYPDEEDAKLRQQAIEQVTQQLQALEQQAHQFAQGQQQPQQQAQQLMQQRQQLEAHLAQLQAAPVVMLYDITVKRSKKGGKLALDNVPPDEFLISADARDIKTARFCGHRVARTASELRSMGYSGIDDLSGDPDPELDGRWSDDTETWSAALNTASSNESQRKIWVTECYVRVDWDGDGISELRKVTRAGNRVLDNEEVDVAPFADIVCVRRPHRFHGLSIADLGMETQKVKTGILRSLQDNQNLQTNGRFWLVEGKVNLDDFLSSRPGGGVRVKDRDSIGWLEMGGDQAGAMHLLEYMEGFGESATGWTRYSQGNSAGKLGQSTATGMNIIANRDDMRVDLIARNFAQGFVEMFTLMLRLVCQNQNNKTEVRLGGKWVNIDPREWRNKFDVNINVGLGVGGKDQQIQQIMAVIAQQEKVHAIGVATPANIYNASAELAKLTGQKSGDKFFTDPSQQPPPPPRPDPEEIKGQIQLQLAQANGQVTMQVENAKLQAQMALEREKMQMQAQVDANEQQQQQAQTTAQQQLTAQLDAHKAELAAQAEAARMAHEMQLEQMRIDAENARAKLDSDVRILIAQIAAQTATSNAATAAEAKADKAVSSDA